MPFPEEGLVFDYRLDDGGASILDDDEEEIKDRVICWEQWTKSMPPLNITSESKFQDIIVPTMDTIRLVKPVSGSGYFALDVSV